MTWLIATISGFAALIGASLSAFLKEAFQDRFQKGRRRREAAFKVSQIIVKIFRRMTKHVSLSHTNQIYQHRLTILEETGRRQTKEGQIEEAGKTKEYMKGLFEYVTPFVKERNDNFDYIVDLEAELTAISIESDVFLRRENHIQFRKTVNDLMHSLMNDYSFNGWQHLNDHQQIVEWQRSEFPKKTAALTDMLEAQKDHYLQLFSEIVK